MKLRQIYSFGFVVAVVALLALAVFMTGCEASIGKG
jgi:hypothetical protein